MAFLQVLLRYRTGLAGRQLELPRVSPRPCLAPALRPVARILDARAPLLVHPLELESRQTRSAKAHQQKPRTLSNLEIRFIPYIYIALYVSLSVIPVMPALRISLARPQRRSSVLWVSAGLSEISRFHRTKQGRSSRAAFAGVISVELFHD